MEVPVVVLAQVDALLGGGERELALPHPQRGGGAAGQAPDERVRVAEDARRLDSSVEQVRGLGQLAALPPHAAENLDEDEELLSLSGCAREGQRPLGMCVRRCVPVTVELE